MYSKFSRVRFNVCSNSKKTKKKQKSAYKIVINQSTMK